MSSLGQSACDRPLVKEGHASASMRDPPQGRCHTRISNSLFPHACDTCHVISSSSGERCSSKTEPKKMYCAAHAKCAGQGGA
jgi:hypothetical protein